MYTFDVDPDSLNEDLTCNMCKKMLHDAYQTICDCKCCRKCIVSYMNDGNEYCPGGKEECREEKLVLDRNVFRNATLNKKVMKLKVRCPNESCQFTSTLTQMEDHLRLCSYQPIDCPYIKIGCVNAKVNRDSMETHLNRAMLTHSQMLIDLVDNLKIEVRGRKEDHALLREEIKLKEIEIRKEERNSLTAVVEELKGEMVALREQMECAEKNQKMLTELGVQVRELMEEIETERNESREIRGEMEVLKFDICTEREESKKMRGVIDVLQEDLKWIDSSTSRRKEDKYRRKETKGKVTGIKSTRQQGNKSTGRVDKLAKLVVSLNMRINKDVVLGSLWFKAERLNELGKKIDSPHLYSHINGYKLQIRVNTSLYRQKTSSYGELYVSSIICQGEYDDMLSWPARGLSVSVSLINHHTMEAYETVTIKYDDQYCNKPIGKDNEPYGNWLVNLSILACTADLIVSNSILLHITARPP